MKKSLLLLAFAMIISSAFAGGKNVKTLFDIRNQPIAQTSKAFLGFGYVDDPIVGDEEVVLKYRKAGAWLLKTRKCDSQTLGFLVTNKVTVLLVLDGAREKIMEDIKRIEEGSYSSAIAGFLLGEKDDGGGEEEKWRAVVSVVKRKFPKKPIAIPAKNARPAMVKMLGSQIRQVSHFFYDLSNEKEPYDKLKAFSRPIQSAKSTSHIRFWVVAPDRLPGSPVSTRAEFKTMSWKIHWLMAAYATEMVDSVLFNQPFEADEFGATLRYLGVAFRDQPFVMAHGEANSMEVTKPKTNTPDLEQDLDEGADLLGDDSGLQIAVRPKACANVANGNKGDVEYLALRNGKDRICLVMVNTSGKRAKMTVELKSKKTGNCTYRRMFIDPETKKVRREAMGSFAQPGMPFVASIDPDCIETITVIVTTKNYNQAGY